MDFAQLHPSLSIEAINPNNWRIQDFRANSSHVIILFIDAAELPAANTGTTLYMGSFPT
jgi:hypothetical protein